MQKLSKIAPETFLRLGLAATYLYSSIGLLTKPENWAWYVPVWFANIVEKATTLETFLRFQGVFELLLALSMLAWFLRPKVLGWIAVLGALHTALILVFAGVDPSTFRDFGLLGGWISLTLISRKGDL